MVLLSDTILPSAILLPKNKFMKKHSRFFVLGKVEIVDGCRVLGSVKSNDIAEKSL